MGIMSSIINLLLQWYVWLPAVLILAFLTWRNYRQVDTTPDVESDLLVLEIPKAN